MTEHASRLLEIVLRFRRVVSIVGQLLLVIAANAMAFWLRFDNGLPAWAAAAFWQMLPWLVGIRALTFATFRLFEGLWRYTGVYDLQALVGGVVTSSLLFLAVVKSPLGPESYPRSIFIIDAVLLIMLMGGIRLSRRLYSEFSRNRPGRRVLVFGAGDAGEMIVRDMKTKTEDSYQPIGFIDDDRDKVGRYIHRIPVLGTRDDLAKILERCEPDEILIAIPKADPATIRAIVRSLEPFKVPIKTLPNLRDIIDGRVEVSQIRNLAVEDLLTRAPVGLDRRPLLRLIEGRRVMVTGAGGSIGSELCRQIAGLKPESLVMLDRYENTLHAIHLELSDAQPAFELSAVIGDITDAARVADVLRAHNPEIVFHAAAHKHVPLMEENPCEAIKNNVRGTRILAQAAEAQGVERLILISTDKAVSPASVMGLSKRIAEMVVQAQSVGSGTSYSIVRFGNVLGSNGSVVPRFMDQIRKGGPVTITHPDIRRYFMLIPEAVQLVLHAASQSENGTTYVLEMGEQVKLVDLAKDLIRLSGLIPDEIPIQFIGLRPGEKLSEALVGPDEEASSSAVEKILRVRSTASLPGDLLSRIERLESDAAEGRTAEVLAAARELIGLPEGGGAQEAATTVPETVTPAAQHKPVEQICPSCGSFNVHRSRARSLPERIKKEFTWDRLFRCDDCGWRGWLVPMEFGDSPSTDPPGTPDLASLDSATARVTGARRRKFSPRNLS